MYHPFVEFLLKGGVNETTVLFVLSIPVILTLLNFARYIVGIKSFRIYGTLATIFLLYSVGNTFRIDNSSDIQKGLIYGTGMLGVMFVVTILSYELVRRFSLHYFPKYAIVIIGASLGIILTMIIGQEIQKFVYLRIDPISVVLLIIVADQILEVYLKKTLISTFFTLFETLIISSLSFMLIANDFFKTTLFQYPWVILVLIVVNFAIGKYTGLRVTEMSRFYELLLDRISQKNEDISDTEE